MTTNTNVMSYAALMDRLSAEHAELLPGTDRLLDVTTDRELRETVEGLLPKLQTPLEEHIAQEDDILFPAYASASGSEGLVAQFRDEHRDIIALRDELLIALDHGDTRGLGTIAARLAELLGDHMRREDTMLFPSARDALL